MSEAKFTKGDWYNCKQEDDMGNRFFAVESMLECGESRLICEIAERMTSDTDEALPSMDECNANYNLIAAAPEMYDLLDTIENDSGQIPSWLWDKIQLTLAKARGEL